MFKVTKKEKFYIVLQIIESLVKIENNLPNGFGLVHKFIKQSILGNTNKSMKIFNNSLMSEIFHLHGQNDYIENSLGNVKKIL